MLNGPLMRPAGYIDWLFTTPLLLVSLAFLAGVSPADTVLLIIADVFMIVVGLLSGTVAAQSANGEKYRWFMYAISNAFFLVIWYILLVGGRKGGYHYFAELCAHVCSRCPQAQQDQGTFLPPWWNNPHVSVVSFAAKAKSLILPACGPPIHSSSPSLRAPTRYRSTLRSSRTVCSTCE